MRTGLYIFLIVGIIAAVIATAVVFNKSKFQDMSEGFKTSYSQTKDAVSYTLAAICALVVVFLCVIGAHR